MIRQINLFFILTSFLVVVACGGKKNELETKQIALKKLKKEASTLKLKISTLQKEITALKGGNEKKAKAILVAITPLTEQTFEHIIKTRGTVSSNKNVTISTEMNGCIIRIPIVQGQPVTKGQTLLQLDATTLTNTLQELQTNLSLATAIFEKQERLWEQNIGTEIQYLQAKTTKEALQAKLKTLQSQLSKTTIRAPFSGKIEKIYAKIGEVAFPGTPLVQLLGQSKMKVETDVSEIFLGRFKKGENVQITIPSIHKKLLATVSAVSDVINPANRTFKLEASIPSASSKGIKPNQLAILSLVDYIHKKAIVIPTQVILTDEKGKFVYVAIQEKGKRIAKKQPITTGQFYNNQTEVLSGLSPGDQLITSGYRDVVNGAAITISNNSSIISTDKKK